MHLGGSNLLKIHNFEFWWLLAVQSSWNGHFCILVTKLSWPPGVFTSASVQNSHFQNSHIGLKTVTLVFSSLKQPSNFKFHFSWFPYLLPPAVFDNCFRVQDGFLLLKTGWLKTVKMNAKRVTLKKSHWPENSHIGFIFTEIPLVTQSEVGGGRATYT